MKQTRRPVRVSSSVARPTRTVRRTRQNNTVLNEIRHVFVYTDAAGRRRAAAIHDVVFNERKP